MHYCRTAGNFLLKFKENKAVPVAGVVGFDDPNGEQD
jgi:hypothetical protein